MYQEVRVIETLLYLKKRQTENENEKDWDRSYPQRGMGLIGMWEKVLGGPFHSESDQNLSTTVQVNSWV